MKENQTPRKDHSRSSENSNRRSKKPHKIPNKALDASSTSASDDFSEETSRESIGFSTISEISDANHKEHFDEILLIEDDSSQTLLSSNLTPSSKDRTDVDKNGIISVNRFGSYVLDASVVTSVEAEIAVNFLRKAQTEILSSANAAPHYRKLLNELTNIIIQELSTLPEERDPVEEVLSMKNQLLFFGFLMWIVGLSVVFFFTSDVRSAFRGPLPT